MTPDTPKKELSDILKRLQLFMDHEGLSAYQINKDAGLTKGLITKAFGNGLGLTSGTLEALLRTYPQLNANWLIVGRGPMLMPAEASPAPQSVPSSDTKAVHEHIADLEQIQNQCVQLVKQIQLMKQHAQSLADDQLLSHLMK